MSTNSTSTKSTQSITTPFAQRIAIVKTPDGKTLPRYKFNADPSKTGEEAKLLAKKYYDFVAKKLAEGCSVSGYLYRTANSEDKTDKKWVEETRYDFAVVDGKLTATPTAKTAKADKTAKTSKADKKSAPKASAPKASAPKASAPKTTPKAEAPKNAPKNAPKADAPKSAEPKALTVEQRLDIMEQNISALTEAVKVLAEALKKN